MVVTVPGGRLEGRLPWMAQQCREARQMTQIYLFITAQRQSMACYYYNNARLSMQMRPQPSCPACLPALPRPTQLNVLCEYGNILHDINAGAHRPAPSVIHGPIRRQPNAADLPGKWCPAHNPSFSSHSIAWYRSDEHGDHQY